MLDLKETPDDSFGGIAAFYSIIHVSRNSVIDALREMKRVLRPESGAPGTTKLTAMASGDEGRARALQSIRFHHS